MEETFDNCYVYSDIGPTRSYNEDAYRVDMKKRIMVLADGVSTENGRWASETAIDAVFTHLKKNLATEEYRMRDAFLSGYREMLTAMGKSGTTMDALVIRNSKAILGHVGDARVYFSSQDSFKQVTQDERDVLGYLTNHMSNYAPIHVTTTTIPLKKGDMLLMCTDGIHGMVSNDYIKRVINSGDDVKNIGDKIVHEALSFLSEHKDNMSLIVYRHTHCSGKRY